MRQGVGFRILLRRRYLFLSRPAAPAKKWGFPKRDQSSRQRPMGAMKRRRRSVRKRNRQRIAAMQGGGGGNGLGTDF
jgi:hypothetical protein